MFNKHKLFINISIFTFSGILLTGCNFFGKKEPVLNTSPQGQLFDGSSIVGTWSYSSSSTTSSRNPSSTITEAFIFDPTSSVRIELTDPHLNGASCTGYGQYRIEGSDVIVYIQALSDSFCPLGSVIHLRSVRATKNYLEYASSDSSQKYKLYANRAQKNAPLGLWDFSGLGGIDNIFFDKYGYFIMQITVNSTTGLVLGIYNITSSGALQLYFMKSTDPTDLEANPLIFNQFITDGSNLDLIETESDGSQVVYSGVRL